MLPVNYRIKVTFPPLKVTHWYGILNSQYSGKRPELNISLTTEMDSTYISSSSENSYHRREERVVGERGTVHNTLRDKNYALTKGYHSTRSLIS